jgi:ATP-dependent helicase/nuclease subunit A
MDMPNEKPTLTEIQAETARTTGQNVLVSAGAGTGKTRVLVERFLHLVTSRQALPTEILALTFTDKAANEMKSRILEALKIPGYESERRSLESAYISTFHAFAARLLKEHPLEAGVDPEFRVMESEESDFLQMQAAEGALEQNCRKGTETFEMVRTYGEESVSGGLRKILALARHEGMTLAEFFERMKHVREDDDTGGLEAEMTALLRELGEEDLAAECAALFRVPTWDWETVERFKQWRAGLSYKKDRKGGASWTEIRGRIYPAVLASRIQHFAGPVMNGFEALALRFEENYEAEKSGRAVLDFDDLQMRALRLFRKDSAVHERLLRRYREKFVHILVDEFQDTNRLQLELIELISRGDNLFLVGDYKQSIYGFRGAEPELFREKEKEYGDGRRGRRRSLVRNFRSEKPVLDFINAFFEGLWEEDDFHFERLEADKSAGSAQGPQVELKVIEAKDEDAANLARMREADWIAGRIGELKDGGTDYGDIAVLFQAMTPVGIYEQALKKAGVPYFAVSGRGFYHQPEIRDMVSFLSFLENPLADIPLAASLRSPLFQICDNTLFWLARSVKKGGRGGGPSGPLYGAIKSFENIPEIPEGEKEKIRFFRRTAEICLPLKDRLKLTELLDRVLAETAYELYVLANSQGVRRYANLRKLIHLAREFESSEPMPLGLFLRTVRRLQMQEVEESEAQIEAEESGRVVRLLSVHRAKGLEYPVVFIADLGRKQNSRESKRILGQTGRGYAMQVWNEAALDWEKPASWMALNERLRLRDREEAKRRFYVAATRAKQRLILTGAYSPTKKEKLHFAAMTSWMEWLAHAPEGCRDHLHIFRDASGADGKKMKTAGQTGNFGEWLRRSDSPLASGQGYGRSPDPAVERKIGEIFLRLEKRFAAPRRAVDLPVSALTAFHRSPQKYRLIYEIGYPDDIPEADKKDGWGTEGDSGLTPADFGTRVHRLLERLDFCSPEDRLDEMIEAIFHGASADEKLGAREIVLRFIGTGLFSQLRGAQRVLREIPFVLNERHGILHGVVDLLYCDKNNWHIVDYKTASGDALKVREAGYDFQVMLYAHAVQRITGRAPASASVYFLKNQFCARTEVSGPGLRQFADRLRAVQEETLCFKTENG